MQSPFGDWLVPSWCRRRWIIRRRMKWAELAEFLSPGRRDRCGRRSVA